MCPGKAVVKFQDKCQFRCRRRSREEFVRRLMEEVEEEEEVVEGDSLINCLGARVVEVGVGVEVEEDIS